MKDYKIKHTEFELIADSRLSTFQQHKEGFPKFIAQYNTFIKENKNLFNTCHEIKKTDTRRLYWEVETDGEKESYQLRLTVYFQNSTLISTNRLIKLIAGIYEACGFGCAYYK